MRCAIVGVIEDNVNRVEDNGRVAGIQAGEQRLISKLTRATDECHVHRLLIVQFSHTPKQATLFGMIVVSERQ